MHVLSLASPADGLPIPRLGMSMETAMTVGMSVESLVRRFYSTIDAQRWKDQAALVSDDFAAHLGSLPQVSFGEWQNKLKGFYEGFPDGHHLLDFHVVEGNRILTVGRFVGSHTGAFMGRAPTGTTIAMAVMHLDRVADGKIVEHTASADLLGLQRQINWETT